MTHRRNTLFVNYYGGVTPTSKSFGGRYPLDIWACEGYVVYVPQPSGAIGFGQEFSSRHHNNWGKTVADGSSKEQSYSRKLILLWTPIA